MISEPLANPYRLPRGTLVWVIAPGGSTTSLPGSVVAVIVPGNWPDKGDRLMTCWGYLTCADFPGQNVSRFHLVPWLHQLLGDMNMRAHRPSDEFKHRMQDAATWAFTQAAAERRFDDRPADLIQAAELLVRIGKTKFDRRF